MREAAFGIGAASDAELDVTDALTAERDVREAGITFGVRAEAGIAAMADAGCATFAAAARRAVAASAITSSIVRLAAASS